MVLPDSHGVSRAPRYSGYLLACLTDFAYQPITVCGGSFQTLLLSVKPGFVEDPYNPHSLGSGFGLIRFRSPLLTESLD